MRLAILFACAAAAFSQALPPAQPVPFSHKQHAGGMKIKCAMCHPDPDPGESMTIAASKVCMQCHSAIKADSPAIQKVAESAKDSRPIKWARVYEIPSYVAFSHRAHLDSKNTCGECHGKVAERDQLFREGDITMGGCMTCHREKSASNDCQFCHEAR